MTTPSVSGAILIGHLERARQEYGNAVVDDALASLSASEQETLAAMVTISWIDVHLVKKLKDDIAERAGVTSLGLQRRLTRLATGDTINALWRILLRRLWDSAIVKRTPILYRRSFNAGTLDAEFLGSGKALFTLSGWPTIPDYDCVGLACGICAVLEYAGRFDVTASHRREGSVVYFDVGWTGASKETIEPSRL